MRAPIDYTNLGYDALREAMLALGRERMPEWTDQSESDLGVLLVELFAYASDITLYYQTRIANNLFPALSDEPDALVQLLRLIGYEMRPPAPATVDLRVAFDATEPLPILIPSGTQFTTTPPSGQQLTFETVRDIVVQGADLTPADASNLRYFFAVPVIEGRTVLDDPGQVSDGRPNQIYPLRQKPVIFGSVTVTVNEAGGVTVWREVETLARSSPVDRSFIVQRDATGGAVVVFGDGSNGMIPPVGSIISPVIIKAVYRVGGGPQGNVAAGTIFSAASAPMSSVIRDARNPQAAAGGAAGESIDRARSFAPRLFRTQERAVTLDDYIDLAMQVPGVGKAKAVAAGWNQVLLFIAPSGQVADPSELLVQDLLAFFESRRMASVHLKVVGPTPVDIYLKATVRAQPYFFRSDVDAAVKKAISDYLAFDSVDFGQPIFLSRIYDILQDLPQVLSLNITQLSRTITGGIDDGGVVTLAPYEIPRALDPAITVDLIGGLAK